MIHSVDHFNIVVRDLDTTIRFYRDLLGFRESNRTMLEGDWIDTAAGLRGVRAEVVFLTPPDGGTRIEVLQYHTPAGQELPGHSTANSLGLRHVAFRVDDMDAHVAQLKAAGVHFLSDPVTVPAGIIRDSKIRKRLCYFLDPDGVILELAQYHESL